MSNPIDPLATYPAVVPTDPTNKYDAPPGPSCFACGGYHCSVNQGLLCLQLSLRETRRTLATAREAVFAVESGPALAAAAIALVGELADLLRNSGEM